MDCIICKLNKGEIPIYKVYEDENFFAFLDINQSAPGHTMVSPKRHVGTLFDLDKEELGELFEVVKKMAMNIKTSELAPTGFTIGANQWKAAGQEVDHLHVHIIPRWENDGGKAIQSVVKNDKGMSLGEVLEKIVV